MIIMFICAENQGVPNYFVLVSRSPFKMLPYSIHEIYEIITDTKRAGIKESYHELRELYSNYPVIENNRMDTVLTEDSNSGFQFFSSLFENVVSAGGNSRVLCYIQKIKSGDILVIADGAAFGTIIENCLEYAVVCSGQRIAVWMPESFEYLILRSGLIPCSAPCSVPLAAAYLLESVIPCCLLDF